MNQSSTRPNGQHSMPDTLFSLKRKTIAVTGGYGHLGGAISQGLSEAGAEVIVLGRNKKKFDKLFYDSFTVHFISCDISSTESISNAFQEIVLKFGKIDGLVNNAFYGAGGNIENSSEEDWNHTIDGALNSVFRCVKAVVPLMKKNGGGRIINISSMYGMVAPDFQVYEGFETFTNPPHYGAAKAGVIQLTRYIASSLGKHKILVNAVSPGPFPSADVQKNIGFIRNLEMKNPLNRIGQPEELKGVIVFLCSEASTYITGQNIAVDGGWTCI